MKRRQKVRKGIILFTFFLFPIIFFYFSPALSIIASSEGIVSGSLIMFALMFFSALFCGRAFCGWVCSAAGCQEAIFVARDKKVTRGNIIKWLIWLPWLATVVIVAIKAGGYRSIDFFYQTTHGISISDLESFIVYNVVLFALIVLPAFAIGKRSFCHHLCWMAPFMIIGRKLRNYFRWPALQLTTSPEQCKQCHQCTESCPMSLPVEELALQNRLENAECVLCGACVDVCRHKVISYQWAKKLK